MKRPDVAIPSEPRGEPDGPPGTLTLDLAYRPPLPAGPLLRFLAARAIPGVEQVDASTYRRTVRLEGGHALLELQPGDRSVELRLRTANPGTVAGVVESARRLFDLDADPDVVDRHLRRSRVLAPLVARCPGLRLPGAFDGFELGVRAILGQQVSVAAASTTAGKLAATLGEAVEAGTGPGRLFPSAPNIAGADLGFLGVPAQKRAAVSALAAAVASGELRLDGSQEARHSREILLGLPGVGPWTAAYIAMRALRDPDAFPDTDLGLRRALERIGVPESAGDAAEPWRPWRGYAAMHLWESLSAPVGTDPGSRRPGR